MKTVQRELASGAAVPLYAVCFTDENNGTAVGAAGIVIRTTNGGAAWSGQPSSTNADLLGVSFADAHTGNAVGAGEAIETAGDRYEQLLASLPRRAIQLLGI